MSRLLPTQDRAVYLELVNTLYRQSPPIFMGNIVVVSLTVFLLWSEIGHATLLGWAGAIYLVTGARIVMVWRDLRGMGAPTSLSWRCWRYVIWAAISGCLWGAMGLLFFAPDNTVVTVFICIVLAGMTGGSVASLSSFWPAYYAYALPTVLPFALRSFAHGTHLFSVLGVLSLFLLGVNLAYSRVIQRTVRDAIALRFENLSLIAQLTDEKERAELANRSKSQFLAAASHDLRQPAHALGLYIGTLRNVARAPRIDGNMVDMLAQRLQSALTGMSQLLNVLLDISRLDAGTIQIAPRRFALQDSFTSLSNQFAQAAAAKGLQLRVRPTAAWVDTDPILLHNILSNLLSNAVRYTQRGQLLLACRRRGRQVEICVYDTGIGIAADQFEPIFGEFYQVHNIARDREQGLGLGLAIVQRTAALLDSRVTLRSSLGKGSCFSLRLTACPAPAPDTRQPPPLAAAVPPANAVILVVDDDQQVLDSMQILLHSWGYQVLPARSLEQALTTAAQAPRPVEMIVSDFRLGGHVTGTDVVTAVRRAIGTLVPALIITGDTSPQGIHLANASGHRIMHKPLDPEQLRQAMAQVKAQVKVNSQAMIDTPCD